ncbi:transcription antitermination factor NusB [Camelliibacillus cellulosilyticus]|uniref:Transcription antitermination protein NusB n=1 Tax=Camelliibacillus cellulosilyticus TaxID=2174486 RepID=A0ABV9GIJ9_9BACL
MNRRQAREKALQAIFQMNTGETSSEEAMSHVLEDQPSDPFFEQLVITAAEHFDDIDTLIKKYLDKWPFHRLGHIDKAILRLAVCELLYFENIPVKVTLNEAIELAKTFGDDDTRRFTNGVLSTLAGQESLHKQEGT